MYERAMKKGEVIAEIRKRYRVTQAELAKQTGLTISFISRVENSARGISHQTISKIARALHVPECFFYILSDKSKAEIVSEFRHRCDLWLPSRR